MTPVQLGSKFVSIPGVGNSTQLIAPSENTNGIIIRTASFQLGDDYAVLSTGLTVPPSMFTVKTPVILCGRGTKGSTSGYQGSGFSLQYPVTIPAGFGLWFSKTGGDTSSAVFVTYDLIPVA
jgi:hypothetical protein